MTNNNADSDVAGGGADDVRESSNPPARGLMGRMFSSCHSDPRGSVHRAWGISLLFVVMYFVLAIIESEYQQ